MHKLLLYIFLLSCPVILSAQSLPDSVDVAEEVVFEEPPAMDREITEEAEEITVDTFTTYTAREFKRGYRENYKGEEYNYEPKPIVKTRWERFLEWLGAGKDKKTAAPSNGFTMTDWLLAIGAGLVILFVVYLVVGAVLGKKGNWLFGRSGKNITINDIQSVTIDNTDFRQLIEQARESGDYRIGVRYYYLWLLKKLSAQHAIKWHWDKTNADYLYEIKDAMLKKDFEYLSYVYDYSWYGEFTLDAAAFAKAEKAFLKTIKTL